MQCEYIGGCAFGSAEFTISAIDENMQVLWSSSGSWGASSIDSQRGYVGVGQNPTADKFLMANGPAVVALAGNTVRVLSCDSGETIYEETFDSPVAGADPLGFAEGDYELYVTCGNGIVYTRRFGSQGPAGGPVTFTYPGPVDNAHLDFYSHEGFSPSPAPSTDPAAQGRF